MDYQVTQTAIATWLAQQIPGLGELLRHCRIHSNDCTLILDCDGIQSFRRLQEYVEPVAKSAKRLGINRLILSRQGAVVHDIAVDIILQYCEPDVLRVQLIADLKAVDVNDTTSAIALVRMADHKGLLCSDNIHLSSGATPNDWIGKDMSQYHIPEEFQRYMNALAERGELKGFTYQALSFQGQRQLMTVNAEIIQYRNDLVRVVQTLQVDLL